MKDPLPGEPVQAHDLIFQPFIPAQAIADRVSELGRDIARRHAGAVPVFLTVLKGAVFFAADLVRACPLDSELSFVRLSSYDGLESSGKLTEVIGIREDLSGRLVIVVEDIIDTGHTLSRFLPLLEKEKPERIEVASLLLKPAALNHPLKVDYLGFEIPYRFVIGYGLDYKGRGRNLPGIYQLQT